MFLWPEGYNRQPPNPLKELIQRTQGDILMLLEEDLFIKQTRLGDTLAIDTLVAGTKGLLEVMFMDYEYVLEEHFQALCNQYSIMWELLDLKVDRVNLQILQHWEMVFDLLNNKLALELQWLFALRIIQFVVQEKPHLLAIHQNKLGQLFTHMQYTHVAHIVCEFLMCQSHPAQQEFLTKGIEQFHELDEITAINFTSIIHDLFTRIKQPQLIEYITTSDILSKLFQILQSQYLPPIVVKNAAHIICLLSNHYSSELQNLDIEEEESEITTKQFQESVFYRIITTNIRVINDLIVKQRNKIGQILIGLIEIVDNLVRITNIQLWEIMDSSSIMQSIIQLTLAYPKSDILVSQIERIIYFIFERALNDYHPFWAQKLILNYNIHTLDVNMFNRQIYSFEQEINTKIQKEMDYITFDQEILAIQKELYQSNTWRMAKWKLRQQQMENQIKLGSQMQIKDEQLIDDFTKMVQNHQIDELQGESDDEEQKHEFIEEKKDQLEEKKDEDNTGEIKENVEQINVVLVEQVSGQQPSAEDDKLSQSSSSSSSSADENTESKLSHSANLEEQSFKRNQLQIQDIDKLRKKSIQFEKISQQMSSAGRRLSLQAGLNIKETSPTYLEFKLDLEKRVLRNINDNSIVKVDELDTSINP